MDGLTREQAECSKAPPAERVASGGPHRWGLRKEAFSEVTGERALSFRDLSLGETAAIPKGGMGRWQNSPGGKSQKRPARSLGTQEEASSLSIMSHHMPPPLDPGRLEPIRVLHQSWKV